jgi:hypothetical protein
MKRPSQRIRAKVGVSLAALALGLLWAQGVARAAEGLCTGAIIEEPFELPDGSEHPAGRLTLCLERNHSPVASLHKVKVDRTPVSLLMSRRGSSEAGTSESPYIMFIRRADGRLELAGYAYPGRDGMTVYTLEHPESRRPLGSDSDTPVILIAARVD